MGMMNGVLKLLSGHRLAPVASSQGPGSLRPRRETEAPGPGLDQEAICEGVDLAGLADAVRAAKILRVLLVGSPEANRRGGVLLARMLVGSGASTVLVDMGENARAAWDMGLIARSEDVRTLAASPTTFADSIHRDRNSRAHVMATSLTKESDGNPAGDAAGAVLAALALAYARTVIVFDEVPYDLLLDLVDENTALVVPEDGAGNAASLDRGLDRIGLAAPVRVMLPAAMDRAQAA